MVTTLTLTLEQDFDVEDVFKDLQNGFQSRLHQHIGEKLDQAKDIEGRAMSIIGDKVSAPMMSQLGSLGTSGALVLASTLRSICAWSVLHAKCAVVVSQSMYAWRGRSRCGSGFRMHRLLPPVRHIS
jgi:hypothetical protein